MPDIGWITGGAEDGHWRLTVGGRWAIDTVTDIEGEVRAARPPDAGGGVRIDLGPVAYLDTVGALMLRNLQTRLASEGYEAVFINVSDVQAALLDEVGRAENAERPAERPRPNPLVAVLERTGAATVSAGREAVELLSFFGLVVTVLARTAINPRRLRMTSLIHHMEETGLNALPILGLLSFLIGVVLAYQGADQLRQFGAEIFVVNLLGVSVLREIGILLTAIIVAGRSGSAFTAQIGAMQVNQEVDAMRTLGLDPVELLIVPRLLALILTLPLLGFFADIVALFGGAVMSYVVLDVTFGQFIRQLQFAVEVSTLLVGLIKAPVFAFVIAMVGCYEGLKVSGSAESVGRLTTKAVVESIFLVIVLDALFSILFSRLGV